MKVDNLEQVLEVCGLKELPKRDDKTPFIRAIGLISTTAADESYCILKMYEGKPCAKQIFVGGMIKTILAVFPYEFPENVQIDQEDSKTSVIEQKEVLTPILHEIDSTELKDAQKLALGSDYGGDWGIKSVNNPDEAREYFRGMAKNGYREYFGKANIKDEARLKEEFLKMVEFIKTL